MLPGGRRCDPASRRTSEQPGPHQEGLTDGLDRLGLLADSDRERGQSHRAAPEAPEEGIEDRAVEPIEPDGVDLVQRQGVVGDVKIDPAVSAHLGEVALPDSEASVRDERSCAEPTAENPRNTSPSRSPK